MLTLLFTVIISLFFCWYIGPSSAITNKQTFNLFLLRLFCLLSRCEHSRLCQRLPLGVKLIKRIILIIAFDQKLRQKPTKPKAKNTEQKKMFFALKVKLELKSKQ